MTALLGILAASTAVVGAVVVLAVAIESAIALRSNRSE